MKKKIVAILATIAAVFGFGFATSAAYAEDYGATATLNGNVATLSYKAGTFAPYAEITVTADDTYVSNVQAVALKTFNAGKVHADGSATLKYTLTEAGVAALKAGKTISVSATDGKTTVNTPLSSAAKTGEGYASAPTTAETGAAVAPYVMAVALLAAAGIAVFAVRKTTAR